MNTPTTDLSIIVPIYNVEQYLPDCIDSLIRLSDLRVEIILVNDGSTDRSGEIADEYTRKDRRIQVLHQINGGASAARNAGLQIAQGEYVAFVDSDDWVNEGALSALYREMIGLHADVSVGNIWLVCPEGSPNKPFNWQPGVSNYRICSGREAFVGMVRESLYLPTPVRYLYRKDFLRQIAIRFEEGIMHEDELWCPAVLCEAERVVITDIDFYYYRQNETSVMHTTRQIRRLESLFRATEELMRLADRWSFNGVERELKSWWYVNAFRLYSWAFVYLSEIRDSSYVVPSYHLDRFWRDCVWMLPDTILRCREYAQRAEEHLRKYTDWRMSDWVAAVDAEVASGKKILLAFNIPGGEELTLDKTNIPRNWVITTDRKYFRQADIVFFHIPSLFQTLEEDLDKPEGQIWGNWYLELEREEPLLSDPEVMELFDISMIFTTFGNYVNKLTDS